nr:AraC family transcriptional regulator [Nocardioides kongjuensis]
MADVIRVAGSSLLQSVDEVDAVVDACTTALRPHRLRILGRDRTLAARLDHLSGALALSRLSYGADVTISEVSPEQDEFIVALPLAGRARFGYGGATALLEPGTMSVVSPYRPFTLEIGHEFDQILVRLDRTRVEAAAALLVGAADTVPVHFDLASPHVSSGLVGLIEASALVASDSGLDRRARLAGQLEALVIDALLLAVPSNLSGRLTGKAQSPSADRVARAMDYMLENLADQFALSAVAAHCGVTLRSLQIGFHRELGTTPGQWLRERRLDRAHLLLVGSDPAETTVTAVAVACGFLHLGDFAARFRQRFGESPSVVLRSTSR